MKTRQEDTLAPQNDMVSMRLYDKVLISDEEHDVCRYSLSSFGPCCTKGCRYCRPNCHEEFDSSNYF